MTDAGDALLADLLRFKPDDLSANGWAIRAGVNRTVWGDIRRHANPSRRTLERLLGAAGSSLAEFEALRVGVPLASQLAASDVGLAERAGDWRRKDPHSIPLLATHPLTAQAAGGYPSAAFRIDPSTSSARIPCPPQLIHLPGLYAITSVNRAMWPRFRQGRRLIIAPSQGDDAVPGDDLLVQLRSAHGLVAILGALVARDEGGLRIAHFTPDRQLRLYAFNVAAVHRVVGEVLEG